MHGSERLPSGWSQFRLAPDTVTWLYQLQADPVRGADVKVVIVGAGNMGRGIATRVVAGGNQVEIVNRDPTDAQKLACIIRACLSNMCVAPGAPGHEAIL